MASPPSRFDQAQLAPNEVFVDDERYLLAASARHMAAARNLAGDVALIAEAHFHAMMAVECLFKHLFCMLRFSLGLKASTPDTYGRLTRVREYGHQVKKLGTVLAAEAELQNCVPFQRLMTVLPGGFGWNEDRYREPEHGAPKIATRVAEILQLLDQIKREVLEVADAG